ncbi:MAG: hypothetical protein Q8K52_06255 [Thiobacillus sp.]|nr:hypothetical protein [Thiobacillus sp.]
MVKFFTLDAADCLDNETMIVEYMTSTLDDPDTDVFLTAVRDVVRARDMAPESMRHTLGVTQSATPVHP